LDADSCTVQPLILLSWAILFDAATLLSVFEPGEKDDDDIE
jgi:hypothetical protein